jgi:hypothetical protein
VQDFSYLGTKPLNAFYPALAQNKKVQKALKKEFGPVANGIIDKLKAGTPLEENEQGAEDTIADLVMNEAKVVHSIEARGGYDNFDVNILRFGPVFSIRAIEFDEIGYFSSKKNTISAAESEFEGFISALKEAEDEDEPAE